MTAENSDATSSSSLNALSLNALGLGLASRSAAGERLDVWYPQPLLLTDSQANALKTLLPTQTAELEPGAVAALVRALKEEGADRR